MSRYCWVILSVLWGSLLIWGNGCETPPPVRVIIEGGQSFPAGLVGKWKEDKHGWELDFARDGKITSAVIPMGLVRVVPGKITHYKVAIGHGKGMVKPGQWEVQYSAQSRELAVEIDIDAFHQDLGTKAIGGNMTYIIDGPVSADGDEWHADWYMYGRYVAYLPEPNEFYNTQNPEFRDHLVFHKVDTGVKVP